MNMDDIKVEPLVRKREGMQPVTVCNDIRVTHLPTGLVVEVPHEFTRSQNQSLKTAIAMLEAVVPNAAGCSTGNMVNVEVSQEDYSILSCSELTRALHIIQGPARKSKAMDKAKKRWRKRNPTTAR